MGQGEVVERYGWDKGMWVGQREVGGVTRRMTCTWWLLSLAVKAPWLGPGGPTLSLAARTGLENAQPRLRYLVNSPVNH